MNTCGLPVSILLYVANRYGSLTHLGLYMNANRWIGTRIDALGGLFAAGLGAYLIYGPGRSVLPSNIGFSLNMAGTFTISGMCE